MVADHRRLHRRVDSRRLADDRRRGRRHRSRRCSCWFNGSAAPTHRHVTRLFVFRPFWYVQLAAPLIAIGGLVGLPHRTAVWDRPRRRRWTVVVVGSLYIAGAVAGYIGSRLLRVKSLEAHVPSSA